MHLLQLNDVEREFDDLIENLDEIGPVIVQEDGAEVGVMISPAHYARLLAAHSAKDGHLGKEDV